MLVVMQSCAGYTNADYLVTNKKEKTWFDLQTPVFLKSQQGFSNVVVCSGFLRLSGLESKEIIFYDQISSQSSNKSTNL